MEGRIKRLRSRAARILPFRGHGTATRVFLGGIVLEDDPSTEVLDKPLRVRARAAWRRRRNREIPHARVLATVERQSIELLSEDDGCFHGHLELDAPLEAGWNEVELELLESIVGAGEVARSTGEVLVPPDDAEFGVICSLDGTVFPTGTAQRLKMARVVRSEEPRTRPAFSGFAAFNRALKLGRTGMQCNPVFYVTKSPWHRFEVCDAFLQVQDIPRGPLFMRGIAGDKLTRIRHLMALYPRLPFVFIGDSGQRDPEVFAQVVEEDPGRIRAVYVCETSRRHHREVRASSQRIHAHDVPMLLAKSTTDAAAHAIALGLIQPLFLRRPEASDGIRAL